MSDALGATSRCTRGERRTSRPGCRSSGPSLWITSDMAPTLDASRARGKMLRMQAPQAHLPEHVDVLVVGGGINGTGIARDAAGRGLRVVLCEQDDLASHTSSASTKLIHGGLRYLEGFHFSLVRKALQEREVLLASAPHIMRPLRFV